MKPRPIQMGVSETRRQLNDLCNTLANKDLTLVIEITHHGKIQAVLLSYDLYDSIRKTIEAIRNKA